MGGAPWSNHFRCVMHPFNLSRKIFSPPFRKESFILSDISLPCATALKDELM